MLTARRWPRRPAAGDRGSLTLLVIGYAALAAVLVVVGVDVSKVFLARRALASAADAAALAGAQSVDRAALYAGRGGCGGDLPIDPVAARQAAADSLADALPALRHSVASLDPPAVGTDGDRVTVRLAGTVAVPFGRVLSSLGLGLTGGRVHVTVGSAAESPVSSAGGC